MHTPTKAKKASQLWPSGEDCVKKVPVCRNLAFPNMKRNFLLFFSLYRKTEHTGEWTDYERSSLSEVTPHWCQITI